jgi:hypothetical protein
MTSVILYKNLLRSSNSIKEFRIDRGHSNREGLNCRTPLYWYIFLKKRFKPGIAPRKIDLSHQRLNLQNG